MLDQIHAKQDPPMPLNDVVPLSISTIDTLRRINSMIEAQLIWSMENIQNDQFPLIMETVARLREKYPTDYVIPTTPRIRREKGQRQGFDILTIMIIIQNINKPLKIFQIVPGYVR